MAFPNVFDGSLTRGFILSLRHNASSSNSVGVEAACKIRRFVRPRGSKGGIRHRLPLQPIDTVVSHARKLALSTNKDDRVSILVPIQRVSTNVCKLKLKGALWNARSRYR